MWKRMRTHFQMAAQSMIRYPSIRSSPKRRKAAASPLFLCTVHLRPQARFGAQPSAARLLARRCRFFFLQRKRNVGCIRVPARSAGNLPPLSSGKTPPRQGQKRLSAACESGILARGAGKKRRAHGMGRKKHPVLLPRSPGCFSYSSSSLRTAMKASVGSCTLPRERIFFLPSFCFSSSFFLRVMSPP